MQTFWDFLLRYAGLVALVCAVVAAYNLAAAYRARREGRSALFDAERRVSSDRAVRSGMLGLVMVGVTFVFFGLALMGAGSPSISEPSTRVPTRTTTPRAGTTPNATTTLPQATSSLPTVQPPPSATNTPKPITTTPTSGKTAVVTGTADVGGLKLRKTPNGDILDSLPDGTVVELLGETQTEVGIEWQKVRDPKGRGGWVASQYLIINP